MCDCMLTFDIYTGSLDNLGACPIARPDVTRIRHVEILLEPKYDSFGGHGQHMQRRLCERSIDLFRGNRIIRHSLLVKYRHRVSTLGVGAYHEVFFEALKGLTGFRLLTIEIRLPKRPPRRKPLNVSKSMNFVGRIEPPTAEEIIAGCEWTKDQIRKMMESSLGPAIEGEGKDTAEYTYTRYLEFHPQDFLARHTAIDVNNMQETVSVQKQKTTWTKEIGNWTMA